MKHKKWILLGLLIAGTLFLPESEVSSGNYFLKFVPLLFCHTLWIQSSIGYNILPGRSKRFSSHCDTGNGPKPS